MLHPSHLQWIFLNVNNNSDAALINKPNLGAVYADLRSKEYF